MYCGAIPVERIAHQVSAESGARQGQVKTGIRGGGNRRRSDCSVPTNVRVARAPDRAAETFEVGADVSRQICCPDLHIFELA